MTEALKYFSLYELRKPYTYFYPINFRNWKSAFNDDLAGDPGLFSDTYAAHLWDELVRSDRSFDRNRGFPRNSLAQQLINKYIAYT